MTTKLNPYDIPVPSHGKDPRGFFETSVVVLRLLVQEDQEILDAALAAGDDDEWIELNRRVLENRRAELETARRNLAAQINAEAESDSEDSQSKLEVARIRKDAVAVQLAEAFAAAGPDAFTDGPHRDTCEAWVSRYRYVRDEYEAAAFAVAGAEATTIPIIPAEKITVHSVTADRIPAFEENPGRSQPVPEGATGETAPKANVPAWQRALEMFSASVRKELLVREQEQLAADLDKLKEELAGLDKVLEGTIDGPEETSAA